MKPEQLEQMLAKASKSVQALNKDLRKECPRPNETTPETQLQSAKPKRDKAPALGAATSGEKESVRRTTIRFIGFRVRPLDPDNFAGGTKDCLDGLQHAALIRDDSPDTITLITEQVRVNHRYEEHTEIIIETP